MTDAEIQSVDGKILFKEQEAWRTAYGQLKQELATREHIDNKP
ncbi:hypothetical protein [Pseudoblastomonas halimionae]|nr:hypothetical protein [Alteriqipengyuania halimionae]